MLVFYTNSILATIVSLFGCGWAIAGINSIIEDDVGAGIAMIAFGLVFMAWGKYISNNKKFKKWWKQVETNNLEPQIAASAEVAIEIYKKNPQKRTLKKIAALNPSAAEMIEKQLAAK